MKRVMMITNDLHLGGVQSLIVDLCTHMNRERVDVQVACVADGGPHAETLCSAGVPVHVIRCMFKAGPIKGLRPFAIRRLARLLKRENIDLVHSHLFLGNTIGRIAARLAGVRRLIASEHNTYHWKNFLHSAIDRFLAKRTQTIVAVTQAVADFTAKQEGIPSDKFVVIRNGVNVERFAGVSHSAACEALGIPYNRKVLGSVGRLVPQKGYGNLLPLLPDLIAKHDDLIFVLVGGGPEEKNLRTQIRELNIEERVMLVGPRDDVWTVLPAFDAFVLPSRYEGLGIVLLEAMAAGVPVVANQLDTVQEVVTDGVDGRLAPLAESARFRDILEQVLYNGDQSARFAAAAKDKVQRLFSIQAVTHQYEDLYEAVPGSQ